MTTFVGYPGLRTTVARVARPALYPWAYMVLRRAQGRAPVRSGKLRGSGRVVTNRDGLRVVFAASNDGFNYANLTERRRPFLRPSMRR